MKKYIFPAAVLLLVVGFGMFGWSNRKTYTDITGQPNYLEQFAVAEMPEEICISACRELEKTLPNSPIIARVTSLSELESQFGIYLLRFRIEELYAGESLSVDDEIWVGRQSRGLIVEREGGRYLECGFVNVPRKGMEYLIFLSGRSVSNGGRRIFFFQEFSDMVAPVPMFCYEDNQNNVVVEPDGVSTYVAYSEVAFNEFFATTQVGLDAMERVKDKMMVLYPR